MRLSVIHHVIQRFARPVMLTAIALVMASACRRPTASTVSPPSDNQPGSATSGLGSTAPGPKDTTPPGKKATDLRFSKGTFDIKAPYADNWQKTESPLAKLGDQMDASLKALTNCKVDAHTSWDLDGGKLSGNSTFKIQDARTYYVEYYSPETEASLNRIISDGQSHVQLVGETWNSLTPPSDLKGGPVDASVVKEWPKSFLTAMLAEYKDGKSVWGPLFRAWSKGDDGITAHVEQKEFDINGKKKPGYRVLAERKSDGAHMEVILDGDRFVPVTIRSVVPKAGGEDDSIQWTATWSFGGHFAPKDFVVPVKNAPPASH